MESPSNKIFKEKKKKKKRLLKYRNIQDEMARWNKGSETAVSTNEERDKMKLQAATVNNSVNTFLSHKKKKRTHTEDHRKIDILSPERQVTYPFESCSKKKKIKLKRLNKLDSSTLTGHKKNYIKHTELPQIPFNKKGKEICLESSTDEEVASWNASPEVIRVTSEEGEEKKLCHTPFDCSDDMLKKEKKHGMHIKKESENIEAVCYMQEFSNPAIQDICPEVHKKKKRKNLKHRAREESDLETDSDVFNKNIPYSVDSDEYDVTCAIERKQSSIDMASSSKSKRKKKRKKEKMTSEIGAEQAVVDWNEKPCNITEIKKEKEDDDSEIGAEQAVVNWNEKPCNITEIKKEKEDDDWQNCSRRQSMEHESLGMVEGNNSSLQGSYLQKHKKSDNNMSYRNGDIVPRNRKGNINETEKKSVSGDIIQDGDLKHETSLGKEDIDDLFDENYFTPDPEEIKKLRETELEVLSSIPELHKGNFGAGRIPTQKKLQSIKDQGIFVRTTFFTPKEDEILFKNWDSFCKEYGFKNPKLFFWHKLSAYISSEKRKKIWQYMGQGLDDRLLSFVRRRCRVILPCHEKRGKSFSKEDDKIMCNYAAKYGPQKFSSLCPLLHRDRDSIRHRWKKITDKRIGRVLGSWTPEENDALIEEILRMTGVSNVKDVDDKKINYKILEKKFNRPVVRLNSHWLSYLKPRALMDRDSFFPPEYVEKILKMIVDMKVDYPQHVNWPEIVEEFKETGLTCMAIRRKIFQIFHKKIPLHIKDRPWKDKLLYLYYGCLPELSDEEM